MSRYFLDGAYYFITVPTIGHRRFFDTSEKKQCVLAKFHEAAQKYHLRDFDFSIVSDHYHVVSFFEKGLFIPKFLQYVNGGSAYVFNKLTGNSIQVWDEYHVYVVEDDAVLARVCGYVVGNPLKHGEVKNFEELAHYPFSSYQLLAERLGDETALEYVRSVVLLDDARLASDLTKVY
ncbi:MAG: transposase [Patescibacteria group bacterium]